MQCYHITAARLVVGAKDNKKCCPLNLTQLRRNKRKCCDRVSGRQHLRADDVGVVVAADTDPDAAEQLLQAINDGQTQDDVEPDNPRAAVNDMPSLQCRRATAEKRSTAEKQSKVADGAVNWVECEPCGCWFHYTCVGFKGSQFTCDFC